MTGKTSQRAPCGLHFPLPKQMWTRHGWQREEHGGGATWTGM